MNYEELVKALRHCATRSNGCVTCAGCPMSSENGDVIECINALHKDAAVAIEALEARLGEAENSVERWKDMYLTKHEPKRGEWTLTKDEIETIRIHMNAIKERLCNQHRYKEAEDYQIIVDKLEKMEVQDEA